MGLCYFRGHLDLHKKVLIVYLMEKFKSRNQRREHNPFCSLILDRETAAHLDQWDGRRTMPGPTLYGHVFSQPRSRSCRSWSSVRVRHFPKLSPHIHYSPGSYQAAQLLVLLSRPTFSMKEVKVPPGISPLPSLLWLYRQHFCTQENPMWHTPLRWPTTQLCGGIATWAPTRPRWLSASLLISVSLMWPILQIASFHLD